MPKLNRPITVDDITVKGFPFSCENCGNKPTPEKVLEHSGACEVCGDSIIAYTVDTAEYIIRMKS